MNWQHEDYRSVYVSGDVPVGAIYAPGRGATLWRWTICVTGQKRPQTGRETSRQRAMRHVEGRFESFLSAARLRTEGGDV